jgi:hypothetical protein
MPGNSRRRPTLSPPGAPTLNGMGFRVLIAGPYHFTNYPRRAPPWTRCWSTACPMSSYSPAAGVPMLAASYASERGLVVTARVADFVRFPVDAVARRDVFLVSESDAAVVSVDRDRYRSAGASGASGRGGRGRPPVGRTRPDVSAHGPGSGRMCSKSVFTSLACGSASPAPLPAPAAPLDDALGVGVLQRVAELWDDRQGLGRASAPASRPAGPSPRRTPSPGDPPHPPHPRIGPSSGG